MPAPLCRNCGGSIARTRYPSGRLEAIAEYQARAYCGMQCRDEHRRGTEHHNWKGGLRRGHNWGYLRVTDGRYVHRMVMEQKLGRQLSSDEHVHHIDGDVSNNSPSNLELVTNSEHRRIHSASAPRDGAGRFQCHER